MKPKCFISYCHENADFEKIECLQNELERVAASRIDILRDKTSIKSGDFIDEHESVLLTAEIVIVLFTPEYLSKIRNNTGGVYREYSVIFNRHRESEELRRSGKILPRFHLIPIMLSGTMIDSIPDGINRRLCEDFTQYLLHTNSLGRRYVPDHVVKDHRAALERIESVFQTVSDTFKQDFDLTYDDLLKDLFLERRYEVLLDRYVARNKYEMLRYLFVKTSSYDYVSSQSKIVLIGRKGSGKSTIVHEFDERNTRKHKDSIHFNVDKLDLNYIYNFLFARPGGSDVGSVVTAEMYFLAVWRVFLYRMAGQLICDDWDAEKSLVDLSDLVDLIRPSPAAQQVPRDEFLKCCGLVRKALDDAINELGDDQDFAALGVEVGVNKLIERSVGEAWLASLTEAISRCQRRFAFLLDGFDSTFDDFRNATLRNAELSPAMKVHRNSFEVNWLTGLLRAILEVRSHDSVFQSKIDVCVTIPHERFQEVEERERDRYRISRLADEIRWSGIELAILIRKRLELLADYRSTSETALDKLNDVFVHEKIALPTHIDVMSSKQGAGANAVRMTLFRYLLRHTFWRPRDILHYTSAMLARKQFIDKRSGALTPELVRQIVAATTYRIVSDEFINELQTSFINVTDVLGAFHESKQFLSFNQIAEKLRGVPFILDGGSRILDSILDKVQLLYRLGFLGVDVDARMSQRGALGKEMFAFSDGMMIAEAMSVDEWRRVTYVIHPIFNEYLALKPNNERIVGIYSDKYLQSNDVLLTT